MLDRKKQLIEELIQHLEGSQGDDLMNLVNKSKGGLEDMPGVKPKGISVEKIDVMKPHAGLEDSPEEEASETPGEEQSEDAGGMGGDDEMTDQELAELLKEFIK